MKNTTRKLYAALLLGMATAYGIDDTSNQFAIAEPIETKLNEKIQESSEFLAMINVAPVEDMKGQALEFGPDGLIAGRTNTDNADRVGTELGGPTGSTWEVAQTDFDVFVKYHTLDLWARFKDFKQRYMAMVYRSIALDRITIGWHGTSVAADTDSATNPLGQDVNKGWLQIMRDQKPDSILAEGANAGKIYIGPNADADYQNLDAAVADLFNNIPVEHRTGNEVVIVGSGLVAADNNKVMNEHAGTPTEKAVGITTLTKSYGGLTAIQVPRFPATGIVVTDPKNLHLYYQEGKSRRHTDENPKRNRVEDYISSNDAYAIGNLNAIAAVEPANVVIVNKDTVIS